MKKIVFVILMLFSISTSAAAYVSVGANYADHSNTDASYSSSPAALDFGFNKGIVSVGIIFDGAGGPYIKMGNKLSVGVMARYGSATANVDVNGVMVSSTSSPSSGGLLYFVEYGNSYFTRLYHGNSVYSLNASRTEVIDGETISYSGSREIDDTVTGISIGYKFKHQR